MAEEGLEQAVPGLVEEAKPEAIDVTDQDKNEIILFVKKTLVNRPY